METGGIVKNWNIYSPVWCPVKIVKDPVSSGKSLRLSDKDPYDYARATRVFGNSDKKRITFELLVESNPQSFYFDINNHKGDRLLQASINNEGIIKFNDGGNNVQNTFRITNGKWNTIDIEMNARTAEYNVFINNSGVAKGIKFAVSGNPERIEFRTGEYRLDRKITEYKSGDKTIFLKPQY